MQQARRVSGFVATAISIDFENNCNFFQKRLALPCGPAILSLLVRVVGYVGLPKG